MGLFQILLYPLGEPGRIQLLLSLKTPPCPFVQVKTFSASCTNSGPFGQAQTVVRAVSCRRQMGSLGDSENLSAEPKIRKNLRTSRKRPYQTQPFPAAMFWEPLPQEWLPKFVGRGEMRQTWFEYYQERRAAIRRKQQDRLTAEQMERYAREARGDIKDLVQVRRRERRREAENRGFFEVTEAETILDQLIKWPRGSDRHPFQRVADLSLKIAGRNAGFRYRLFKVLGEEAERGTSAAAIYEAIWETLRHLADDVLDEAIGVVYDVPLQEPLEARIKQPKAKAASAA